MKRMSLAAALMIGAALSGCAGMEPASRNAPLETAPLGAQTQPAYALSAYNIRVPRALKVSEANSYYPGGDIVWRGEPLGDRHQQVANIFRDSLEELRQQPQSGVPATLDIELVRFHALTEKARYTIGGVHAITFDLTLRDPQTGQALGPTRRVKANLEAFGGARAIAAEQNGITQRFRITNHLVQVFRDELTRPGGHRNAATGVMGLINEL